MSILRHSPACSAGLRLYGANVSALDKATGKSQNIRIEASSGLSEDEIKRMKAESEAHADQDKKAKEEVEKINCYGCEHRLKKENEVSNADGFFVLRFAIEMPLAFLHIPEREEPQGLRRQDSLREEERHRKCIE